MWESQVSGCQWPISPYVQRPAKSLQGQPLRDDGVFIHILVVIEVDELMPDRLAEDQSDRQQKKTADGRHRVGVMRPKSQVCRGGIFRRTAAIGCSPSRLLTAAGFAIIRRPVFLCPVTHDETVLKTSEELLSKMTCRQLKTFSLVSDKKLISTARSIGGVFLLVKGIMIYDKILDIEGSFPLSNNKRMSKKSE